MHFIIKTHNYEYEGFHSSVSFTKDKLYPNQRAFRHVAEVIAKYFINDKIDFVLGVEMGGSELAQKIVSFYKEQGKNKIGLLCLKKDLKISKPQKALLRGKNILFVDDTLRSGKTFKISANRIRHCGGHIVGAGFICARNVFSKEELGLNKIYSFIIQDNKVFSFKSVDCPMCKKGKPILERTFV